MTLMTDTLEQIREQQQRPFAWRRDGWVLAVAMVVPTLGTWLYFDVFAGQGTLPGLLYSATKGVQVLLPVTWMVLARRHKLHGPRWQGRSAMMGLAFGVLTAAAILPAYFVIAAQTDLLSQTVPALKAKLADFRIQGLGGFVAMALFISLLHAGFEEYYWRWFVFRRLSEGMKWQPAAVLSSLAFAAHHVVVINAYLPAGYFWTATMGLSLAIACGGAVWAWIYQRTGHIVGAWVAHVFADLAIMYIGFDLLRGHLT